MRVQLRERDGHIIRMRECLPRFDGGDEFFGLVAKHPRPSRIDDQGAGGHVPIPEALGGRIQREGVPLIAGLQRSHALPNLRFGFESRGYIDGGGDQHRGVAELGAVNRDIYRSDRAVAMMEPDNTGMVQSRFRDREHLSRRCTPLISQEITGRHQLKFGDTVPEKPSGGLVDQLESQG